MHLQINVAPVINAKNERSPVLRHKYSLRVSQASVKASAGP